MHFEKGSGELVGHYVEDIRLKLWHCRGGLGHVDGGGRCVGGRGGDLVEGADVGGHDCSPGTVIVASSCARVYS